MLDHRRQFCFDIIIKHFLLYACISVACVSSPVSPIFCVLVLGYGTVFWSNYCSAKLSESLWFDCFHLESLRKLLLHNPENISCFNTCRCACISAVSVCSPVCLISCVLALGFIWYCYASTTALLNYHRVSDLTDFIWKVCANFCYIIIYLGW